MMPVPRFPAGLQGAISMPLSDEERRRLESLEQELAAADPDLNFELQSGKPRGMAARGVYGLLALVAGFGLVIAGISMQLTIVGVVGFVLMGAGAHWFLSGFRPLDGQWFRSDEQGEGTSSPSGPEPGTR